MTKAEFKQYLDYQIDILFDGEKPEQDGQARVDIVSAMETLSLVQVNTFGSEFDRNADKDNRKFYPSRAIR